MYNPSFRTNRNNVPILTGKEINIIAENYVRDFQRGVLENPAPVDVESFIEHYLGMTPDYQYLSHNGVYLGMTVFNDTDKVVVYSPHENKAKFVSAKARTVIIDNRLLEENQQHRYRFTLGHEAGHDIFHSVYYSYDPCQFTFFDSPIPPMIQCRTDNPSARKNSSQWDDHDWMEWHANRFSSCFLMPEAAVRLVATEYDPALLTKDFTARFRLVHRISDIFNVSLQAATYRLKDLSIFCKDDAGEYSFTPACIDFEGCVV